MKWTNFGDVNFIEHGGKMVCRAWDDETVRDYPGLETDYKVFVLSPWPESGEDVVLAALKTVDVNDVITDMRAHNAIVQALGFEPETPEEWASEAVSYFGVEVGIDETYRGGMYPREEDYFISRDDAAAWMEELGIPLEA